MSCDIELEIGAGSSPGDFITRVVDAPSGGGPSAVVQLDVDRLLGERDALETTVLASAVSGRRIIPAHEQQLQRVGRQLFEALFSGPVLGTYRASYGIAQERGEPLRVVLRPATPQLAALPWEALFDPEKGAYICREEPLVRRVPAPYTREPLKIIPPLRVLDLVASPRGLPALDVTAEQEHLSQALATPIAEGLIEVEWLPQASWDAVQEKLLSDSWHVLHFIGHGDYDVDTDQGVIALVGEDGRANLVGAERLADLLKQARPTPRLVVLNSCSSGEQGTQDLFSGTAAALVRSGISAVAAMQFTISDPAAISFARGFYTAIAHGRSVDDAVGSGRISILGRPHTLEWVTPVLYVRGESTQLFSLASPERKGRHHEKPLAQGPPKPTEGKPAQTSPPEPRPTIAAAQLRAMYVQARAELRAEHYDAAIGLLDDLLSLASDYRDAAVLRDNAVRRRDLVDRYQQAIDAQAANDWSTAARLYEQVLELQPDYRDAAIRREQCEKAQRIIDLQDELRLLAESKNWQAVIDVSDELAALDPEAADPDRLATSARDTVRAAVEQERIYTRARGAEEAGDWSTAISHYRSLNGYWDAEARLHTCQQRHEQAEIAKRREAELANRYAQGVNHLDQQRWKKAAEVFAAIEQEQPGYRDAAALLTTAQRQRDLAQRLRTLVDEVTALHQAGRWKEVVAAAKKLGELDPDHPDPYGIVSDARARLREAELANRYAQGVALVKQQRWKKAAEVFAAIEQEQPGYRDAAALLTTAQRQRDLRFRLGIPATLIAVAGLTGAVPPIYLLRTNYPVDTGEIWHWQTASRILIGISFCFLAWMAKPLGDRCAMLSAALMVPVIVLHVVNGRVLARDDLEADLMDFLKNVAYPTILALAAMVGILFGVAVIRKYSWASVLIAWGVCGLLEAFLSYEAKIAPWRPGEPPLEVWKAADTVLVVQNMILLAVAVFMFLDLAQPNKPASASV